VQTKRIAVIGVGNVLMGDEGIGVRVMEKLSQKTLPESVTLFEAGTAFHALVGELADYDKLVIVDVVEGSRPPGTIYRFDLTQALEGTASETPFSLHEMGIIAMLELERLVRQIPGEVVFVGVEPERIAPSLNLSPLLEQKLSELTRAVLRELDTQDT
jgi:hydrogenase maturation protease